ncbi:MAG TPA: family 43 glycosylhydrolase [Pyrinomonadaceae bacterium]|jgi:beta-xylosidase|nr:family 43 glycosylhydrolase [Pyrinomonadaceae bacterium]
MGRSLPGKHAYRTLCAALLLALLLVNVSAQRRRNTYTNPAMAGDFPDPSVIRIGGDYWAAATSSEWAPEFPILHSRDLVNWEVVGAVFQKRPDWSTGSYWAPEISFDRGRFFIYYAARKKNGPLCVAVASAARPQGPYRDHGPLVCQEVGSIDGFPVTDENGQRYLLWKEDGNSVSKPTPIWAQRLSADGTRLIGERRELFHNDQAWEKHASLPYGDLVEGPAVVRRGGWFYIFYSGNFCCARECNYMMGVARSRKLLGPWEKNPANPILRGNETWKCPGHGTVVSDARGRDFLLYHAYKANDFVYVGRQALLDEIKWGADDWPTINGGRGPSNSAASPFGVKDQALEYAFFDEFKSASLLPGWQWPVANEPEVSLESRDEGLLVLAPSSANQSKIEMLSAVLARSTTVGDYVATTRINTKRMQPRSTGGLSAYGDHENALGLAVVDNRVTLWRLEKGNVQTVTEVNAPNAGYLFLRMTARDGHLYRFAFSKDNRTWTNVGEDLDGAYLPPWDRGVRVALTAGGAPVRFNWLRVTPSR